jgi:hypothetical protein
LLLAIRDLGGIGSLSHLRRLLTGWHRAGCPVTVDAAATAALHLIDPSTGPPVSPIVAAALCVKPRGLPTGDQAANVDAFSRISPAFATMRALALRFWGILRGGDVENFTVWLNERQPINSLWYSSLRPYAGQDFGGGWQCRNRNPEQRSD